KLAQYSAQGDESIPCKKGSLGLRYTATSGVGEKPIKQHAHGKRSCHGDQHAPPGSAAHRIEAHPPPLREHNKRDHGEPGKRSNQQRQNKKYLLLALPKVRDQARNKNGVPL